MARWLTEACATPSAAAIRREAESELVWMEGGSGRSESVHYGVIHISHMKRLIWIIDSTLVPQERLNRV